MPGRAWGWAKGAAATLLPLTFRIILVEFHLRKKKVSRIEPLSVPAAPAEMHPTIGRAGQLLANINFSPVPCNNPRSLEKDTVTQ